MLQRRTIIAAAAVLCFAAIVPARAGDAATANDTARFLAGLAPATESPLARLASERWWQQHAQIFDSAFDGVEHRQLARIRAWSGKHLGAARPTTFYMFSGPDFLYVNAFFPESKTFVLSAREPVGNVPDLNTMRGSQAPARIEPAARGKTSGGTGPRSQDRARAGRITPPPVIPPLWSQAERAGISAQYGDDL